MNLIIFHQRFVSEENRLIIRSCIPPCAPSQSLSNKKPPSFPLVENETWISQRKAAASLHGGLNHINYSITEQRKSKNRTWACLLSQFTPRLLWYITEERAEVRCPSPEGARWLRTWLPGPVSFLLTNQEQQKRLVLLTFLHLIRTLWRLLRDQHKFYNLWVTVCYSVSNASNVHVSGLWEETRKMHILLRNFWKQTHNLLVHAGLTTHSKLHFPAFANVFRDHLLLFLQ